MPAALPIVAAIVIAALACASLTWALMPLLRRYALARPNARSSHTTPTPQGAGIAVMLATFAAATCAAWSVGATIPIVLLIATLLLALVGAVDDIRPIPVLPRLGLQALAAGAALAILPGDAQIVPMLPLWIERAVLFVALLWFVNLVNFMDGLDWMTVAEIVPVTLALTAFGLSGALPLPATLIAAALCGAHLGFAPFNKPVAKVFLGDVGSLPVGLVLGWCLLELALSGHAAAALLLPLYYLADSTLTLVRRMWNREAFWHAHRSHFYQRATDNGFAVIEVAREVLVTNVALAVLAAISFVVRSPIVDAVTLACGAGVVTLLLLRFARPHSLAK